MAEFFTYVALFIKITTLGYVLVTFVPSRSVSSSFAVSASHHIFVFVRGSRPSETRLGVIFYRCRRLPIVISSTSFSETILPIFFAFLGLTARSPDEVG